MTHELAQLDMATDTADWPDTEALLCFEQGLPAEPAPAPLPQLAEGCSVAICTYQRAESLKNLLDSLLRQTRRPDQLVIVDASQDRATEQMLEERTDLAELAHQVIYRRVSGPLRGLTRQRNVALQHVTTDLVAFFDDDIVLEPDCLAAMERVHRDRGDSVVGVGARDLQEARSLGRLWRLRRQLGIVPDLRPGTYYRSGMSTPWGPLPLNADVVEGDWLLGGATMWRTELARQVRFCDDFVGYSQGEDLFFSLLIGRHGKLVVAGDARLHHLHDPSGRPDHFKLGYMAIYNRFRIHRDGLVQRSWRDRLWFTYAWSLDTLLLARHLFVPSRWRSIAQQVAGRLKAATDIICEVDRS